MKKEKPSWKVKREREILCNVVAYIVYFTCIVVGTLFFVFGAIRVLGAEPEEAQTEEIDWTAQYKVSATAYYDAYGYGYGSTGQPLVEGLTVAGRKCDIGRTVLIYECNEDGSIGDLIMIGEFRDVGYGQPTGCGSSSLISGRSIGTIEAGQCIDIYFDTYTECAEWGRRDVYILIVDAKG